MPRVVKGPRVRVEHDLSRVRHNGVCGIAAFQDFFIKCLFSLFLPSFSYSSCFLISSPPYTAFFEIHWNHLRLVALINFLAVFKERSPQFDCNSVEGQYSKE